MSGPAFAYARASSLDDALRRGAQTGAVFLAGGTDFMQLWKAGVQAPTDVIDNNPQEFFTGLRLCRNIVSSH